MPQPQQKFLRKNKVSGEYVKNAETEGDGNVAGNGQSATGSKSYTSSIGTIVDW
jgi:hypothetical protein